MSDRLVKILVGVLAALLVGYGIIRLATGRSSAPRPSSLSLAQIAEADLDSAIIITEEETVRLRAGERWTVNGYEAIEQAGESLKRALEKGEIGQVAARNPENHERLGVADGQGYRVSFYSGGEERLTLIIGEKGGGRAFDEAYVRRAGEDEVYVLKGSLVNLGRRGVIEWRNKEILAPKREDIQRIELEYPEESFVLARDTTGWRVEPGGAQAEQSVVDGMLVQLSGLRALGFASDSLAGALSWEEPTGRVRVLGPGGAQLGELLFLSRDDPGYFVRRADGPVVYTLSRYSGDQILKKVEDLVPAPEE